MLSSQKVSHEPVGCASSRVVDDELEAVVDALCAKYPRHPRSEVEAVVRQAYGFLAQRARVTTHLIPLALNRSHRLMRDVALCTDNPAVDVPECLADLMAR